jgi:hypothetical protein
MQTELEVEELAIPTEPGSHEEIAKRAYYLWDANNQEPDSAEHYWYLAERLIRLEQSGQSLSGGQYEGGRTISPIGPVP